LAKKSLQTKHARTRALRRSVGDPEVGFVMEVAVSALVRYRRS
jgi:hypothetical protein